MWRAVFRVGFPIARTWWRLSKATHVGALVAIYVDGALLLVRASYRAEWTFPGGGVRAREAPAEAAQRELLEEIGLAASLAGPTRVLNGVWDGFPDCVHVFELKLDQPPALRLDNREIVAVRLVSGGEVDAIRLTGPVAAYLQVAHATA